MPTCCVPGHVLLVERWDLAPCAVRGVGVALSQIARERFWSFGREKQRSKIICPSCGRVSVAGWMIRSWTWKLNQFFWWAKSRFLHWFLKRKSCITGEIKRFSKNRQLNLWYICCNISFRVESIVFSPGIRLIVKWVCLAPHQILSYLFLSSLLKKQMTSCLCIAETRSLSYLLSHLRVLLSVVKKGIFKSDSSSVFKSEYDHAGFSSFAFEIGSDKNPRYHNDLKCLSLPVELICLSCCHLRGAEGLGVVISLINALIENLWRAKQHLPTKLMLVVSPLFILALATTCAACTSGTRTRLPTAVHWN